jgi:hypothetical protein
MNKGIPRLRMFAGPNGSGKIEMKTNQVPAWFKKALGSKFDIGSKEVK